jgi:branched-chain amino acid transport system permease protein
MIAWLDGNLVTLLNGVAIGFLIYTMAVGLSLVFGMMDVLNLAHGSVFLLGAYVAYSLAGRPGGFPLAMLVALLAGAVAGLVLSAATSLVASRGHLDQAVLTLGLALLAGQALVAVWGSDVKSVQPPSWLDGSVTVLGDTYPTYRLAVIGVGLALAIAVYFVIERTRYGIIVRAAVADQGMTGACGVNTRLLLFGTFAAGTALAAAGGVLAGPVLGAYRGLDNDVLILALIVVIVGGLGSAKGALIGALIVGQVKSLGVVLLPEAASVLLFLVLAIVIVVRPNGIAGKAQVVTHS